MSRGGVRSCRLGGFGGPELSELSLPSSAVSLESTLDLLLALLLSLLTVLLNFRTQTSYSIFRNIEILKFDDLLFANL